MNAQRAYQTYIETAVNVSDPVELTRMLYRGAIDSIQKGRQALAERDIRNRAIHVSRAQQIVAELATSLNPEHGGEITDRLSQLYEYILHSLQTANFEQREQPLAEAQRLLETLLEAWESPQVSAALLGATAA